LLEITASSNSGTIVIADRAGKEQLTQVMARRELTRENRPQPEDEHKAIVAPQSVGPPWLAWSGLILVLFLAAIIWAIFQHHW